MRKLSLIIIVLYNITIRANTSLVEIREVLKYVETGYDSTAIGDNGKSFGILQIQQVAIDDVNRKYGTHYTHQDAFDVQCAEEIFDLYIKMWVERLELNENRPAKPEDIVRIWNGGPRGYKRKSTIKYLERFKKFRYLYNSKKDVPPKHWYDKLWLVNI